MVEIFAPPRIVLCTLNARFIHAALGLRYLLANLDRHGGVGLRAQAVLREYTVARAASEVVADLLQTLGSARPGLPQIIGLGVYIWNVTQTLEVIRLLKVARPEIVVVLGGPEVSHETQDQAIVKIAEHVICGWGEVSFAKMCRALMNGQPPPQKMITGEQPDLTELDLPYGEYSDADLAHRLLYVEASRGCPFKCEFCLSALDKTAWSFELTRVLAALQALYQRGARHFKFVDRTFNLKIDSAVQILQFFLDKLTPVTYFDSGNGFSHGAPKDCGAPEASALFLHFEVIPDHLPERLRAMLAQFPAGVLQLEVGVQTFNTTVQQTLSRRQDNLATEANLRWLLRHTQAHLHADLIFGLPGETLHSFAEGFDRLLAIGPHEIQLGLLKRLRGAPLSRHSQSHGMVYATEPPYTVQRTGVVDADTVQGFTRFARYWDVLANSGRFTRTLALLLFGPGSSGDLSPFWRFLALSDWLWQRHGVTHRLSPEWLVDALFDYLSPSLSNEVLRQALLADYLASGARANPRALHGYLPRTVPSAAKSPRRLASRQMRHQVL